MLKFQFNILQLSAKTVIQNYTTILGVGVGGGTSTVILWLQAIWNNG